MKKNNILVLLAFGIYSSAMAQQVTLSDCLEQGLQNNWSLKIAKNTSAIADKNLTWANAGALPTADLSLKKSQAWEEVSKTTQAGVKDDYHQNTSGLVGGLSASWMLFDGLEMYAQYDQLKLLKAKGELQLRQEVENVLGDIAAGYYELVVQLERRKNLRQSMKLSQERLRIAAEKYSLGAQSRLELLQAKVDFNSDSSKYVQQRQQVQNARIRLNQFMGRDQQSGVLLPVDTVFKMRDRFELNALLESVEIANTQLLISKQNVLVSGKDVQMATAAHYPYLSLSGGYGYSLYSYSKKDPQKSVVVGPNLALTLGYRLWDGGNIERKRQIAKLQLQSQEYNAENVRQQVMADFYSIYRSYQNNASLVELENENIQTARENMGIAMERYKLGALSGLELREAQNSYLEAQERVLNLSYTLKVAELSLMQIAGRMGELVKK